MREIWSLSFTAAFAPAFTKCSDMYRLKYDSSFIFFSSLGGYWWHEK
jgi:hypothetical protein